MDRSMNTRYISGGAAVIFGGFLLLYLIPNHVSSSGDAFSPDLFPSIAAWIFIVLGALQMILPSEPISLPSAREFKRTGMVALVVLGTIVTMEWLGYIIVAITFMAIISWMMYERRPVWLIATIVAMPIGIWLFFEVLLRRPLPPLPF